MLLQLHYFSLHIIIHLDLTFHKVIKLKAVASDAPDEILHLRKCLKMEALIESLAMILIAMVPRFIAFDLTIGHLGWSHKDMSYSPLPTLENSASAVSLGVRTFYERGGSRDINIR